MDSITYNGSSSVDIRPVVVGDHGLSCYALALVLVVFSMVLLLVLYTSQLCQKCNIFKAKPSLFTNNSSSSSTSTSPPGPAQHVKATKQICIPGRKRLPADIIRQSPSNLHSSIPDPRNAIHLATLPENQLISVRTPRGPSPLIKASYNSHENPPPPPEPSIGTQPSSSSTSSTASNPRYNTPVSRSEEDDDGEEANDADLTQQCLSSETSPEFPVGGSYSSHSFDFYRLKRHVKHFPGRYGASTTNFLRSTPEKPPQLPRANRRFHQSHPVTINNKPHIDRIEPKIGPNHRYFTSKEAQRTASPNEASTSGISKHSIPSCHQQTQTEVSSINSLEWDHFGTAKVHLKERGGAKDDPKERFDAKIYHITPNMPSDDVTSQNLRSSPKLCKFGPHRCSTCNLPHIIGPDDEAQAPSNDSGYERPLDLSKITENDQI